PRCIAPGLRAGLPGALRTFAARRAGRSRFLASACLRRAHGERSAPRARRREARARACGRAAGLFSRARRLSTDAGLRARGARRRSAYPGAGHHRRIRIDDRRRTARIGGRSRERESPDAYRIARVIARRLSERPLLLTP